MKVLHLNSYYIDNHLYSQLFNILETDTEQRVFIPIKFDRKPENVIPFKQTELIFEQVIQPVHKYDYFGKIRKITNRAIQKKVNEGVDFVHAHNLFTDGAVAYELKKKFGLKYIVAVRTTDIGLQYKYMYHRRFKIQKVLLAAEHIIFISPTYRDKLLSMMSENFIKKIENKIKIIPNGINTVWLEEKKEPTGKPLKDKVNLLYVGQIMARKNLDTVINAIDVLNQKGNKDYHLTIIGGANTYEQTYFDNFLLSIQDKKEITYLGKINDKYALLEEYRKSDIFVMPSKAELFGLVYIEALSQGKPILYSKGEGINGYLEDKHAGIAVNPNNTDEIADGIENIAKNYETYTSFTEIIAPFNWASITTTYKQMYAE